MSSRLFGFKWVHSGAIFGSRVHSRSRGITRAHTSIVGSIRVCVGSLERTLRSSDSFVFAWVHSGAPSGLRVHSVSRGLTLALISVVGYIRVRVGSLGNT